MLLQIVWNFMKYSFWHSRYEFTDPVWQVLCKVKEVEVFRESFIYHHPKCTVWYWKSIVSVEEFDSSLTSEQCKVCSKFSQQCEGKQPTNTKKKKNPTNSWRLWQEWTGNVKFSPTGSVNAVKKCHCLLRHKPRLCHQQMLLTRVHLLEVSR